MPYPGLDASEDEIAKLDSCVEQVMAKGRDKSSAIAICRTSMNLSDKQASRYAFEPFGSLEGVLKGEPFKILPVGRFYRDDRILNITEKDLRQIESNVTSGLPRFRIPINPDHKQDVGKIGTVHEVKFMVDGSDGPGLYAMRYDLTDRGKKLVKDDGYDAPSAELIWTKNGGQKYQDPTTGEYHDNVLVGVALTPKPFFGHSSVALYSANPPEFMQMDMGKSKHSLATIRGMIAKLWQAIVDEETAEVAEESAEGEAQESKNVAASVTGKGEPAPVETPQAGSSSANYSDRFYSEDQPRDERGRFGGGGGEDGKGEGEGGGGEPSSKPEKIPGDWVKGERGGYELADKGREVKVAISTGAGGKNVVKTYYDNKQTTYHTTWKDAFESGEHYLDTGEVPEEAFVKTHLERFAGNLPPMVKCPECGHTMPKGTTCPECGYKDKEKMSADQFAQWTTAMVNDLPDSSFLYIAPGGDKDENGKTVPRALRYFPYKNADGKVDLPHLRNALARIPQSSLPQRVKTGVINKAHEIAQDVGIGEKKDEMADSHMDMKSAHEHLMKAIALHQKHLSGDEPANKESQNELMNHLKQAMSALGMMDEMSAHGNPAGQRKEKNMAEQHTTETFAVSAEEFAALKAKAEKVEALEAQAATLKTQADKFGADLMAERDARRLDQITDTVETFRALPLEVKDTAAKLMALEKLDSALAQWVTEKFTAFDRVLGQSKIFEQLATGRGGAPQADTYEAEIDRQLAAKFGGDKAKYQDAMSAAAKERPDLFTAYVNKAG